MITWSEGPFESSARAHMASHAIWQGHESVDLPLRTEIRRQVNVVTGEMNFRVYATLGHEGGRK